MKKEINIFVSFAYANHRLVEDFMERFTTYILPSKRYNYKVWLSSQLYVGDEWDAKILKKMQDCDCAILLISPAFLISPYIIKKELPILLNKSMVLPIMLHHVDLEKHDMRGVDKFQIYRLNDISFKEPRPYYPLNAKWREAFVIGLFNEIEARLLELV